MTELVLRDVLGKELRFKRIGDIGYQVTVNGVVTQIAYIDCGQVENLQVFLAEQLGVNKTINDAANKFVDNYSKDVWNAAIEEALKVVTNMHKYDDIAKVITELKK